MIDTKLEIQLKLNYWQFVQLSYIADLIDHINKDYENDINTSIDELWNKYVFKTDSEWIKKSVSEFNNHLSALKIEE